MDHQQQNQKNENTKKTPRKHGILFTLLKICILLLVLLAAGISIAIAKLDGILKFTIEKAGSYVTQTPVTVEAVNLKILDGQLVIRNLAIANPEPYDVKNAMEIHEVFILLDVSSLLGPEIRVHEVRLDGAQVSYVARSLKKNNISDLCRNIQRLVPAKKSDESQPADQSKTQAGAQPAGQPAKQDGLQPAGQPEEQPVAQNAETPEPVKAGKKVVIDQVNITNTKFAFGATFIGRSTLDLLIPDIHLKDLGKEQNLTTVEAVAEIFDEFFKGIRNVTESAGKIVDDTKDAIKETAKTFKDIFKELKKARKKARSESAPVETDSKITVESQNNTGK